MHGFNVSHADSALSYFAFTSRCSWLSWFDAFFQLDSLGLADFVDLLDKRQLKRPGVSSYLSYARIGHYA